MDTQKTWKLFRDAEVYFVFVILSLLIFYASIDAELWLQLVVGFGYFLLVSSRTRRAGLDPDSQCRKPDKTLEFCSQIRRIASCKMGTY